MRAFISSRPADVYGPGAEKPRVSQPPGVPDEAFAKIDHPCKGSMVVDR